MWTSPAMTKGTAIGFSVDTVQHYEQGRRVKSGPVIRALDPHRARRRASVPKPG
jgi:hypothetical protein